MTSDILNLSERQLREKEFYEQFVRKSDWNHEIDFSPVSGRQKRPWNSYWEMYHIAQLNFKPDSRLLDFGSGPGDNAVRFSEIGYHIEGFDICESNVEASEKIFARYNRSNKGNFVVATAEKLPYQNDYFDFIAGVDILHHVDIEPALRECKRVLKKEGMAVFREPLEVPFLDVIRNLSIVKMLFPKEKSLELHITEDERKLTSLDLEIARKIFPDVRIRKFFILARFDKLFRKGSDPAPSLLERLDYMLIKMFPFMKHFGGVIILELRK